MRDSLRTCYFIDINDDAAHSFVPGWPQSSSPPCCARVYWIAMDTLIHMFSGIEEYPNLVQEVYISSDCDIDEAGNNLIATAPRDTY